MTAQATAIAAWGAVPSKDRYAQLAKIKQPVLIVNGGDDRMVPSKNSFIMQQQITDAMLVLYPDSGHGAIFQYHDQFVAQALTFLDS